MKNRIFVILFLACAAACRVSANGKCTMLSPEIVGDERSITYSCVEASFDDVKDIASEADEIQFTVSKLEIPARAFARFRLRKLSFLNCVLRHVDPQAFAGLTNLEHLTFFESNIHVLNASWFRGLHKLTYLSLKKNNLVYIEPKAFLEMPNLNHLDLENNNLNCLPPNALATLRYLRHFRMEKNPWLCSCHEELVRWLLNHKIDLGIEDAKRLRFECMVESSTNVETHEVNRDYSTPEVQGYVIAPGNTSCVTKTLRILWPSPDHVGSIKLSGLKITTIPEFAFFQFGNSLRSLNLSNCSITNIHPKAFAGLPKLQKLILFNNSIGIVKAEWFTDLRGLKVLELARNGINDIESGVFPLLDKLEILNLEQNAIECLSADTFGMMRRLRRVNIAKNPWKCACLNDFTSWLNEHQIQFHMTLNSCTNGNVQANGGSRQGLAYWSSSYHNESFNSNSYYTEYHDDVYTKFENDYREISQAVMHGSEHQRNKKSVQYNGQGCSMINAYQPKCDREQPSDIRCPYKCTGSSIIKLNMGWCGVPDTAESIEFEDTEISVISNYAFHRFGGTLRSLKFINCKIGKIEPLAFAGLHNLQELILNGNQISEIQASWFKSTTNLQRLLLTHNYVTRIENGVFQHLSNLQQLGISDNHLNCIGIDSLNYMKNLRWMGVDNNPWSCLCRNKLIEWMTNHNIIYNVNFWKQYPIIGCDDPSIRSTQRPTFPTPPTTSPTLPPPSVPTPTSSPPTSTTAVFRPPGPLIVSPCVMDPPNSSRCTWIGGNKLDLNLIPIDVKRIKISSTKVYLNADGFARFRNLEELEIHNCSIEYIDDSAFNGLSNLKLLVLRDNVIPTIKSTWFHDLIALTELDLAGNHVMEIEADAFDYLYNLRVLSLHDNEIQCIYTKSLNSMRSLEKVSMQNNPLKWRCIEELRQYLDARKINYKDFAFFQGKQITCELNEEPQALHMTELSVKGGTTHTPISTVNVLCVSIAMLIFTKF